MEVILLDRIQNLGDLGDTVRVKPGYGRNYLLPQGKALRATKDNAAVFEARKAELLKKAADSEAAAKARAEALAGLGSLTLTSRASEEGKLYGSIGPREIADAITEAGVTVDKGEVVMPDGPIRSVGEHDVLVHLYATMEATMTVVIEAE
ncbi:MAG: 50S ribosomal protein L9 [Abyssibacter sp.]|jgi:large subunit ribosomal protein L9|nr:50S ribosomal protein L9 [Abyssibacter sp.]MCK5858641.1 50S ribosomal protein L9 [Abyssibacter sp.]